MLDDYSARLNAELRALHAKIFNEQSLLEVNCPVCGSDRHKIFGTKDGFSYRNCKQCQMIYMSPRLTESATLAFYNSKANEVYNEIKFHGEGSNINQDNLVNYQNLKIILQHFKARKNINPPLRLLEVGCGSGFFLKSAQDAGFDVYGIELNKRLLENAKKLLGSENIVGIEVQKACFQDQYFDVIYLRDVIEHIHDPIIFIQKLSTLMKKGGILFLETHNVEGLIFKAVGVKHTCFFGFEHPVHWSPKTLSFALQKCGLNTVDIRFESADCTLYEMVNYYKESTFTTIFKLPNSQFKDLIFRSASRLLRVPLLRYFDKKFTPTIANYFGRGSTMKVIAIKN